MRARLRNQVVFAPAGSGKTERLSRRYIELLEAGVKPERILTLTFTEKAAAEMKERIFERLAQENPDLHRYLRENVLRLRISTIHSFCLALLKRFAPALGLDPRVEVLPDATELWTATKYDTLMHIAEQETGSEAHKLLMNLVTQDQVQAWPHLSKLFDSFFDKRVGIARARLNELDTAQLAELTQGLRDHPLGTKFPDYQLLFPQEYTPETAAPVLDRLEEHRSLFLTKSGTPLKRGCNDEERAWNTELVRYRDLLRTMLWYHQFGRSFALFRSHFLAAYDRVKRESGQVDYDDMEYLALHLLTTNPEWQNILYAFDEQTDHLLVDEFQDTSFLQWGIIDKLTEEWRSGKGAKADLEVEPTIFIVGDDKQSIYMFRDAKVEVFATAANQLEKWLGTDQLERIQLENNFRSLQAIIDFNNELFSKLMDAGPKSEPWQTRYAAFKRGRENKTLGRVEILLDPLQARVAERRARDAANIARRIKSLVGQFQVFDPDRNEAARACAFGDIAILIRSRTHLAAIEQALRDADIRFIVIGGTGFYSEPEVRYLEALVKTLADPADDIALYATLRGPVFNIPERELFLANSGGGLFLWDRVRTHAQQGTPLAQAVENIEKWRQQVHCEPLARVLEHALAERETWRTFWEPQRLANARKFLSLIEAREAGGEHPLRILKALEQAGPNEPKADVRAAGYDAVQVLTIHSAKGLQFPVVFVPGLDQDIRPARGSGDPLVIEETGPDQVVVSWIPDSSVRKQNQFHARHQQKQLEEEKRVLYVACTRARDGLFLTGIWNPKVLEKTRLEWLIRCLGLKQEADRFALDTEIPGVVCISPGDIPAPVGPAARPAKKKRTRIEIRKPEPPAPPLVRPITRNISQDYHRHSDDLIGLGEIIHRVLEQISNRSLTPGPEHLTPEIRRLLRLHGLASPSAQPSPTHPIPSPLTGEGKGKGEGQSEGDRLIRIVLKQIEALKTTPEIWEIIAPRPDARAELPIMYSDGSTLWSGRIDRIIETENEIRIYDYKTFPVKQGEIDNLTREYHQAQLRHYAAAMRRMKPNKKVSTYIIFTALPRIIRTGQSG